jgi:hypothetical protein
MGNVAQFRKNLFLQLKKLLFLTFFFYLFSFFFGLLFSPEGIYYNNIDMDYYTQLLKKIDKPEKLVPIASFLAVTGISLFALKKALAVNSIDFKSKGAEQIPIPPGAVYYLGNCLTKRKRKDSITNNILQNRSYSSSRCYTCP